jgi:hypothetical protein
MSHVALSPEDRGFLERSLTGRDRDQFLRLSFYVTPFFGDASKRLLTAVPPDEVFLIQSPHGEVIGPGPVQRILPAGTAVRIEKVEFPTSYVIPQRMLYTPRTDTWVYVRPPGDLGPPLILVIRQVVSTAAEGRAELERYLTQTDPKPVLDSFSPPVRDAIRKKQASLDMPSDALERAWGYPERKQVRFQDDTKTEEWIYPGGKRRAFLQDGRVTRFEEGPPPASAP